MSKKEIEMEKKSLGDLTESASSGDEVARGWRQGDEII